MQVFINTAQIQKLVALRVKYLLIVCKEAPVSVPELVLETSSDTREMLQLLYSQATDGSEVHKFLVTFDVLQTSSTWVQMWADALNAKSVPEVLKFISSQTGLQMGSGEDHDKKKFSLTLNPAPTTAAGAHAKQSEKSEKSETEKPEKIEKPEKSEKQDAAQLFKKDADAADAPAANQEAATSESVGKHKPDSSSTSSNSASMTLKELELFRDEHCIKAKHDATGLNFFETSEDAKNLGIKHFTAAGMMQMQKSLESALWHVYTIESDGLESVTIDFGVAKKDAVSVRVPVPRTLSLPFMGPVTQSKGTKGLKICSVFGVDFFIHPCGENLQTADVLVPAWHCKAVTKADQAFFYLAVKSVPLWMVASGGELSSVAFFAEEPKISEDQKCQKVDCALQLLYPQDDIQKKLDAELKVRQDKAQKSARNAINQSIRQQSQKEKGKKAGKQPKKEKSAPGDTADAENVQPNLELAVKKAQEDEVKLDKLVADAVASCQRPTSIPITRLSSDGERAQSSTRALLMQNILKEKEALDKSKANETAEAESTAPIPSKLGVPAAVQAFNRDGILQLKKKKGKTGENSVAAATENVMKMGKHVLK